MKTIQKLLTGWLFALLFQPIYGQNLMIIHQGNGTKIQLPLESIDSIRFATLPPPVKQKIFQNNGNVLMLSVSDIDSITYDLPTMQSLPQVSTEQVVALSSSSINAQGSVQSEGSSAVTQRGFCWSQQPLPSLANNFTVTGSGTGSFGATITPLQAGTLYYVRAFATNSSGTAYGSQLTVNTQNPSSSGNLATITTNMVQYTPEMGLTAVCGGNVTADGGLAVTARGVCWAAGTTPTLNHNFTVDGFGAGSFTSNLTGLLPNTQYFVRAYATNDAGTVYGVSYGFTTIGLPVVQTDSVFAVNGFSATAQSKVTSDGGSSITARGVVWSTSPNPTIGLSTKTNDGAGIGTFISNISGLSTGTTYFVRAYATSSTGTAYGNQASISTPEIVVLQGNLPTMTLVNTGKYLLKGFVFVNAGQTLTIQPGTIIFGDKATKGTLVINRGGRIIAEGTAQQPIVFTSKFPSGERDKGDWGGIIILGNANVNQASTPIEGVTPSVTFGTFNSTANDAESSGVLKYVRIEYAGVALSPNNEINGLTFGGVGSGTVVENVQVSYSGDDAFEWFGGTVNCKNLIAYGTWDDDFDTDFGYTGKVQFALALRDPFNADQSGSNAFESDNDAGGTAASPKTAPVFCNVTVLGPRHDSIASISASYRNAIHFRRRTATSVFNSVITGFPTGIFLDGNATMANYTSAEGEIKDNLLISLGKPANPFAATSPITVDSVKNYYLSGNPAGFISKTSQANYPAIGLNINLFYSMNVSYPANPNFAVNSGSIISGANFTHNKLSNSFFQQVPFLGAFGQTDWTVGWSNFNPQIIQY